MVDSLFFCKACSIESDSDTCDLHDILETPTGRVYLFECPYCGEMSTSDISYEREIAEYNKER